MQLSDVLDLYHYLKKLDLYWQTGLFSTTAQLQPLAMKPSIVKLETLWIGAYGWYKGSGDSTAAEVAMVLDHLRLSSLRSVNLRFRSIDRSGRFKKDCDTVCGALLGRVSDSLKKLELLVDLTICTQISSNVWVCAVFIIL